MKRLFLKIRSVPVRAEFAGAQVELELSKTHGRFGFGGNSHRALLQIKAIRESLTPDWERCATKWASFQSLEDTALAPCHKYVTRRRIRAIDCGGRAVQSCVREVAAG